MAKAPRLIDRLPQEDLDHFAEVQDLLRAADLAYTVDTTLVRGLDYYTRTLFEFQSGALEAAQNTLGGGGRYDGLAEAIGGAADARHGLGGGRRADADGVHAAAAGRAARRPVRRLRARPQGRRRSSSPPTPAAPATAQDSNSRGRSVKGQLKQASRIRASLRCHLRRRRRPASRPRRRRGQGRRARNRHAPHPGNDFETTTREPVPRRLGRGARRRARRRARARGRLGAPPARPRRRDLHRPARPLRDRPADVPSRVARRSRSPRSCGPSTC